MKRTKTMAAAAMLVLAAGAFGAAAPRPAAAGGIEAEADICQRALISCLGDVASGGGEALMIALRLTYCLSGNEFCKKYVAPFL